MLSSGVPAGKPLKPYGYYGKNGPQGATATKVITERLSWKKPFLPKKWVETPLCANCQHPRRQHSKGRGTCQHILCTCTTYKEPDDKQKQ